MGTGLVRCVRVYSSMAKKPKERKDPFGRRLPDYGIGQLPDGTLNIVPLDELEKRIAERNADEAKYSSEEYSQKKKT